VAWFGVRVAISQFGGENKDKKKRRGRGEMKEGPVSEEVRKDRGSLFCRHGI